MVRNSLTSAHAFRNGLGALVSLNLFDAIATSTWVASGIAEEGNPVMAQALAMGHGPFVLGKIALVGLGAAMLWRLRQHLGARVALVPMALLYAFVGGSHVGIGLRVLGAF